MRYVFFSTGSWEKNASMVRLRELGREMIARGVEVCYAVDDVPFNREKIDLDPRATVVYSPVKGPLRAIWARRRTIRELRPDYVHVLNPAPKSGAGLWGSRWRVVGDWDEWHRMADFNPARKAVERYLDHWLRRRASLVVVCSRYLQNQFKSLFNQDSLYLPYATYLPSYPPTTSPFAEPTLVYMGNLYPSYDHDLIREAAVRLKARGLTPPLLIMGGGPDLEKWRAVIKEKNLTNVSLPGFLSGDELWRRLRHAHALLFPIRDTILNRARCPSKTFAYAQARRPVITNRVGEVPEVLGERARYVEISAEGFERAMEEAMRERRDDIDYNVEAHNWGARAQTLIDALGR